MRHYRVDIKNPRTGLAVVGATVAIRIAAEPTLAVFYDANDASTAPHANPYVTVTGLEQFYFPDNYYDITASFSGTTVTDQDVEISDLLAIKLTCLDAEATAVQAASDANAAKIAAQLAAAQAATIVAGIGTLNFYVSNAKNADGTIMYGASDANDGLTPDHPKLTLAGVIAVAARFGTIWMHGGSVFLAENPNFQALQGIKLRRYGQGPKPIITARARLTSAVWTQPNAGLYPNVWMTTVALPANPPQATAILNSSSSIWGPHMYDERRYGAAGRHLRIEDVGLTRQFSGATRPDCLAAVQANKGSFYTNVTGSATVNPQANGEAGNSIDVYVSLIDGANPNGQPISFVDQRFCAQLPEGADCTGIRFECTGSKDMLNMAYSTSSTPGSLVDCDIVEFSIHGGVWTGVQVDGCKFVASYTGQSRTSIGGGIHQFRGTGQQGMSLGFKVKNSTVRGAGIALYSHGAGTYPSDPSGEGYWDHLYAEFEDMLVQDCTTLVDIGNPLLGVRLNRVKAYNVDLFGAVRSNIEMRDSSLWLSEGYSAVQAIFQDYSAGVVTLINSAIFAPGSRLVISGTLAAGGGPASYMTLKLVDSIIYQPGGWGDPGVAARRQFNMWLGGTTRGVLAIERGSYFGAWQTPWIAGTVTVSAKSHIETAYTPEATWRAAYPPTATTGINAAAAINVTKHAFSYTVTPADLTYPIATPYVGRACTYSGTPDTGTAGAAGSTATLTLNAGINVVLSGGSIRVVDAYGAGLHFTGRVLNKITGTTVSVTPSPTGAFASKGFCFGSFNQALFGPETTAAIAIDGTQVRVTAGRGGFYAVGNWVHLTNVPGSLGTKYLRKITAISGDVLTLDTPVQIKMNRTGWLSSANFHSITGTPGGTTSALPTCTIARDFAFHAMTYSVVLHDALGTIPATPLGSAGWFQQYSGTAPAFAVNTYRTLAGLDITTGVNPAPIDSGTGMCSTGFTVCDTDVLTVESTFFVDELTMFENLANGGDNVNSTTGNGGGLVGAGQFLFKAGSIFAADLGYQAR